MRVLVVEDDPDLAEYASAVLRRHGNVTVEVTSSGRAALESFHCKRGADILITDIELPGMAGIELAAAIRQADPNMPVAMMTAHASVDYAVIALRNQIDEFLVKPVPAAQLRSTLAGLIQLRTARNAAAVSTPAVSRDLAGVAARTRGGHRVIIVRCVDFRRSSGGRGPQRRTRPVGRPRPTGCSTGWPAGSPGSRPAGGSAGSCSGCWPTCRGRTAGRSPSTPATATRTACSTCSPGPAGTPTASATTCATTSSARSATPTRCWCSTRPAT